MQRAPKFLLTRNDILLCDYVPIHADFEISKVDETESKETLQSLHDLGEMQAELSVVGASE